MARAVDKETTEERCNQGQQCGPFGEDVDLFATFRAKLGNIVPSQ